MRIVVTGATGKLGALAVEALLARGIDGGEIVAVGRNAEALAALEARGIRTARADFGDPASLRAAFDGADRILIISVPGNPDRQAQHRNAIRAAGTAGAKLVVYTSWMRAATSTMMVAADHRATEQALIEAGLPHAILRCSGYFEARTAMVDFWRARGEVLGAAGTGRVSSASRADLAAAAAEVIRTDGHHGAVYELGSDVPYTLEDFAAEISRQTGTPLPYVDVPVDELTEQLVAAGLDPRLAANLADFDRAQAAGEAVIDSRDLRRLVQRPLTELPDAVFAALRD